jgi:hypothetical protein
MQEVKPESKEAAFIKVNDREILLGIVTACKGTPDGSNISQTFYDSAKGTFVNFIVPKYDVRHETGLYQVRFDPEWVNPYIFNYEIDSNQVDPEVRKELIPQALKEHDGIKHYRVDWRIMNVTEDKQAPGNFICTPIK